MNASETDGELEALAVGHFTEVKHSFPRTRWRLVQLLHQIGPEHRDLAGGINGHRVGISAEAIGRKGGTDVVGIQPGDHFVEAEEITLSRGISHEGMIKYDEVVTAG